MLSLSRALLALVLLGTLAVGSAGCDSDDPAPDDLADIVYVLTNAPSGNAVVAYEADGAGGLTLLGSFPTGGDGGSVTGTPDPLAAQNALYVTDDGRFVLAVNNGSASVTSFRVQDDGRLERAATAATGMGPVSVDARGGFVYVANNGAVGMPGRGSVSGFTLGDDGALAPIAGASRPGTDAPVTAAASVAISPDGRTVIMTEKATSRILAYPVQAGGALGAPTGVDSPTPTPFGAEFMADGTLLVSEANAPGGPPAVEDGSAASSWRVVNGALQVVSASVANGETASCWIEPTPDGRYVYTSNTPEASVSLYRVGAGGALSLVNGRAAFLGAMGSSLDMAIADDVFYVLVANPGEVQAYRIGSDGALMALGTPVTGLVTGEVAGLATLDR